MAGHPRERDPRLLVLGAGPAQLGLLEAARAHGVWTAVCDRDPGAPGFELADRRCIVSTEDEPALDRLATALEPDGVIAPGTDWPVAVAARIAERLGLAHPVDPATAVLATNKLRQREALAAAGVPQPRFEVVADGSLPGLRAPCVVKPPDRQGQKGLTLVLDDADLPAAIEHARGAARSGLALVEERVDGPEVTVIGFSAGGELVPLAVTDRITADPPAFGVALAHVWPSPHAEAAVEVARRAVAALGIEQGPSYTQLRVGPGGPEVIEVAARLGGGHDAELVHAAVGVDLNGLALAAALGDPPTPAEVASGYRPRVGGAVTRFLVAPPGVLESVEVPQGQKGVLWTRIYRGPGAVLTPLRRGSDRAGALLAVGATRAEALARAESAAERIRFVSADAGALV
ncbi:MAG TPA: ATP-grasp domain-containing protein [Gaiellaceae bacterium]|nr:ATP-grasp domain-containing protein [Gaiellaceae bacterium]